MNSADMKATLRRYYDEIWGKGRIDLIDDLMTDDYVNCDLATPAPNGELHGREAMKGLVTTYRETFPDLTLTITKQYAEGDVVISEWIARGTMVGAMNQLAANGKTGSVPGVTISQFRNGKIVRDTAYWNLLHLLSLLGYGPELPQAA